MPETHSDSSFDPREIARPDPVLMSYYVLLALLSMVAFPVSLIVLWCKYHTLRYRFDNKGVSMSWGVLFRRETYLTYRRIQDIHVTRNIIQRWLGLATISLQTASGTSGAEMSIEGILKAEALRNYLYAQMRGAKGEVPAEATADDDRQPGDEVLSVLCEIRDELRRMAKPREAGA